MAVLVEDPVHFELVFHGGLVNQTSWADLHSPYTTRVTFIVARENQPETAKALREIADRMDRRAKE